MPVTAIPRLLAPIALAAACVSGCGSAAPHAQSGGGAPASPARGSTAAPPRVRLAVRRSGRLPAPVQLPAVAPLGSALLAIAGLDAADASSAAIVRVRGGHGREVGRLPAPLHDAAAATVGRATYFLGGGEAGAGTRQILRVSAGGGASEAGSLPV